MLSKLAQETLKALAKIRRSRGWPSTNAGEIHALLIGLVAPDVDQESLRTQDEVHLIWEAFKFIKQLDTPQAVQILLNYAIGDYDPYCQGVTSS